jgi:Flp pilus assembly protein TadB
VPDERGERRGELPRDELEAAVEARRELGRERERDVVDSFLDRVEREIDARVDERIARRGGGVPTQRTGSDWGFVLLAISSLGIGIAVTGAATAADDAWVAGVAWIAIVLVNWLYYRRPR